VIQTVTTHHQRFNLVRQLKIAYKPNSTFNQRANLYSKHSSPFCRFPLLTLFYNTIGFEPWRPVAVSGTDFYFGVFIIGIYLIISIRFTFSKLLKLIENKKNWFQSILCQAKTQSQLIISLDDIRFKILC